MSIDHRQHNIMKHTESKLRVGATVRFLNAKGGGRVARITGDTAWVEDEDGFEIPTLARECVVVESGDTFMPAYKPPKTVRSAEVSLPPERCDRRARPQEEKSQPEAEFVPPKPHTFLPASGSVSAYLAFLPMDEKQLGRCNYEAYLINDSKYSLFYTYSSREGVRWSLRSSGFIDPDTQHFLEEFASGEVNNLELINIQIIAFADNPRVYHGTYSIELRLDGHKFFRLGSYKENDFFDEGAWVEPLVEEDVLRSRGLQMPSPQAMAEAMQTPQSQEKPRANATSPTPQPSPSDRLVVDLHIDALLDDTTGMNNAAMLRYQLDKFNEVMQENLKHVGRKIVFIHGKGAGVLRNKIEGELRYRYAGFEYQDASFLEYSYGATQVTIGVLRKRAKV